MLAIDGNPEEVLACVGEDVTILPSSPSATIPIGTEVTLTEVIFTEALATQVVSMTDPVTSTPSPTGYGVPLLLLASCNKCLIMYFICVGSFSG